jgi:hypothetical protein
MKVGDVVKIFAASQHPPGVIVGEDTDGFWFVLWNDDVIRLEWTMLEVVK